MSFTSFALRDAAIIAATVSFWTFAAPRTAGDGPLADFLGVVAGLAVTASFYLLHEWGHLLGGLATGSVVHPPPSLSSRSLFSFDSRRNDRRQFLVMSIGGFIVTAAAAAFVYAGLSPGLLATRVARGGVGVLVFLAIFVESPLVVWALLRSDLPPVDVFAVSEGPDEGVRAT
jgi:hypothetical protein